MKKIELVFRTVGERTSEMALELALKHIAPDKVHRIDNVKPFTRTVEEMLLRNYDAADFVVFMDADCLIMEDMRPFLNHNSRPYVDCYVQDKFRGTVHMGVHITRIDVVQAMQQIKASKNNLKYVLKAESYIRNLALKRLKKKKHFKHFKILHDFCQFYRDIFVKYGVRELRSRKGYHRQKLDMNMEQWPTDDLDFVVARQAVEYTRQAVPLDASAAEIAQFIIALPEIAGPELQRMGLAEKSPVTLPEVETLTATLQPHLPSPRRPKVFGIGLSRTCTKSLTLALNILGVNVVHYPNDEATYNELVLGQYNFSLLNYYDGITDITVSPFYPHLDRLYPDSKFILTMRDKEAWLASLENHWASRSAFASGSNHSVQMEVRRFLRAAVYGCYTFNRERMSYVYDLHYKNVTEYFKGRPDKLLILNITAGDGWEKLCPFLGKAVVHEPFPDIKKKSKLIEFL
jgi:hypothetical protein